MIVVAQIVAALALGAAIGLEREFGAQPAGLRTHMLVCLGATLFVAAAAGLPGAGAGAARVAAQVVTGIGFLGGGVIFREGVSVRGLTTAASLWVTAAIGVAVGLAAWWPALVTTGSALGVLWLVKQAERTYLPLRRLLVIRLTLEQGQAVDAVAAAAREALAQARVVQVVFADARQVLELTARPPAGRTLAELAESMRRLPGVAGVDVSG